MIIKHFGIETISIITTGDYFLYETKSDCTPKQMRGSVGTIGVVTDHIASNALFIIQLDSYVFWLKLYKIRTRPFKIQPLII